MIQKELIKSPKAFFVKDTWHNEFCLYSIIVDGNKFTYHHLPLFFNCNEEEVLDTLNTISKNPKSNIISDNTSLNFFKSTIDLYLNLKEPQQLDHYVNNLWPHCQLLLPIDDFINKISKSPIFFKEKRIKIKTNYESLMNWCHSLNNNQHLLKTLNAIKCQLVFDLNQSIYEINELVDLIAMIKMAKWRSNFLYLEEPATPELYINLPIEDINLIGLDESLLKLEDRTSKLELFTKSVLLNNCAYYIIKPSILKKTTIDFLLQQNKPISLSSSYEHPSLKLGFTPYLNLNLNNKIHGLSTFEYFN